LRGQAPTEDREYSRLRPPDDGRWTTQDREADSFLRPQSELAPAKAGVLRPPSEPAPPPSRKRGESGGKAGVVRPLVVTRLVKSALRIVAINDAAQRLGLRPGMPLADARAMYPAVRVAESDEAADRRLLDAVAEWCDRYTPLIGLDPPDGLVLDVTGCAHLFGGEAALARDLLARLAAQRLAARAGVADTVGCAVAVARHGGACVVPPRQTREALAPLPAAALRIAPETAEALAELGLKRIADIIDLPRAPLAARFGETLIRRLDQALGRLDEPITPRLPVPSYVAEQRFPHPIGLERDVLATIGRLAARLGDAMERRQEGARLMQVALFRADNKVFRIEVGTGAPVRDAGCIVRLFADRLAMVGEACDPGFGYDVVRLAALVAERSAPEQIGLGLAEDGGRTTEDGKADSLRRPLSSAVCRPQDGAAPESRSQTGFAEPGAGTAPGGFAAPADDAEFSHLLDRFGARFGLRRVIRLVPQDTHIPEFAVAAMPWAADRGRTTPAFPPLSPRFREGGGAGSDRRRSNEFAYPSSDVCPPSSERPVRLFGRPEPVEAIAEIPDGPPARFRWRRVLHEVAAAEGPERIAMEWWRDAAGHALTRDYFRVESRDGLRVWLYREGLYGETSPRWFLHGLFG
jgi:protein ImuB